MDEFKLKPGMLVGAASAAAQIEGGNVNHSWMEWSQKGKIHDGSSPARANGHYRLWREDADLMRVMGLEVCRLGVEWARIEPEPGVYNGEALEHYLGEISLLLEYGIKPLVTLHHFANPLWFEKMGGFEKPENIPYFLDFVERAVRFFGKSVNEYITINEPNVYSMFGYFYGTWPPGKKSLVKTMRVMSVMAAAHIKAYALIHRLREEMGFGDTRVSFASHVRIFSPQNPANPLHRFFAAFNERLFQGSPGMAMYLGIFSWPLTNFAGIKPGRYCDFIAINYYTRSTVKGPGDGVERGVPVNDLGWEIYPAGIVMAAEKLYSACPLPIYITENGTCDNNDSFRSRYIYDHLRAVSASDLPIERYYHWCFCDNFEWLEGESARFGIVEVDYETQKRTIKKSGAFFSELIKERGVSGEMYARYVRDQAYRTN